MDVWIAPLASRAGEIRNYRSIADTWPLCLCFLPCCPARAIAPASLQANHLELDPLQLQSVFSYREPLH